MKTIPNHKAVNDGRNGFTILELVVVIAIITILISLIAPALSSARSASHRLTCSNNLRQLALGVTGQVETTNLFPYAHRSSIHNGNYIHRTNWVTDILPWIDESNISDHIDQFDSINDYINAGGQRHHVSLLTCPADISITGADDLSYAANTGVAQTFSGQNNKDYYFFLSNRGETIDLNGDGKIDYHKTESPGKPDAASIQFSTSLFMVVGDKGDFPGLKRPGGHRPATITDGMSNTIMLMENVRCGVDPNEARSGWIFATVANLSAGIPDSVCPDGFCGPGTVDLQQANRDAGKLNSGLNLPEGMAPWGNSFHAGGVNAAFADGRVQFVSDTIDGRVLFQMYTPRDNHLNHTAFNSLAN